MAGSEFEEFERVSATDAHVNSFPNRGGVNGPVNRSACLKTIAEIHRNGLDFPWTKLAVWRFARRGFVYLPKVISTLSQGPSVLVDSVRESDQKVQQLAPRPIGSEDCAADGRGRCGEVCGDGAFPLGR